MLIILSEYAALNNKKYDITCRHARTGRLKTAVKLGSQWFVDSEEPYPTDLRRENNAHNFDAVHKKNAGSPSSSISETGKDE